MIGLGSNGGSIVGGAGDDIIVNASGANGFFDGGDGNDVYLINEAKVSNQNILIAEYSKTGKMTPMFYQSEVTSRHKIFLQIMNTGNLRAP